VNNAPTIVAEVTPADWQAAGNGWTHWPYMARFKVDGLPNDWRTLLKGRFAAVLESGRTGSLCFAIPNSESVKVFSANGRVVTHASSGAYESPAEKPLDYLKLWSKEHRAPRLVDWPDFQGGLILALGYELATQFEPVVSAPAHPAAPSAVILEANEVCIFDKTHSELTVVVLCAAHDRPEAVWRIARVRAQALADEWIGALQSPAPSFAKEKNPAVPTAESLPSAAFQSAVKKVKDYIAAGDTYQVNLSTRLELANADLALAYEAMRQANPSPYMGFLRFPGGALACGSPELLVEVSKGKIFSRPIAGTRPRGSDDAADEAWAKELSANSKECAEHLMLVDLLRNDVGRVALPGTVSVPEFMAIERYSHVMHLVSQVEGQINPQAGPAEIIRALFPGGTITGAPKVRTMQIIGEVEPVARGFYTGSMGWLSASGDLCLNIVIRSLWSYEGRFFAQAGAGIVADSDPAQEYAESIRKAQAPLIAAARAASPTC
jgi:para-aminobenzoate synthetase component 1